MKVDWTAGDVFGLLSRDQGMDAKLTDEDRIGRRITKVSATQEGGAVYFITAVGAPYVKIGWLKKPERLEARMLQLQTGSPYELIVSGKVKVDSRRAETVLHKRFQAHHLRGEWFRCDGDLKIFIQMVAAFPELSLSELLEKSS